MLELGHPVGHLQGQRQRTAPWWWQGERHRTAHTTATPAHTSTHTRMWGGPVSKRGLRMRVGSAVRVRAGISAGMRCAVKGMAPTGSSRRRSPSSRSSKTVAATKDFVIDAMRNTLSGPGVFSCPTVRVPSPFVCGCRKCPCVRVRLLQSSKVAVQLHRSAACAMVLDHSDRTSQDESTCLKRLHAPCAIGCKAGANGTSTGRHY